MIAVPWRVVAPALIAIAAVAFASPSSAQSTAPDGAVLFDRSCSSCHGPDGMGTEQGPSLVDEGEAAVDFVLRTGRMPPGGATVEAERRPRRFTDEEVAALVGHVGAMGSGPGIPVVDLASADPVAGGELYRQNCAACHQAGGAGGALSGGRFAPSLFEASSVEVVEATLVGPGAMPVFSHLDDGQRADLAAYVRVLQDDADPGGAALGRVGPVGEGLMAWTAVSVLVAATMVIGRRQAR